MLRKWSQCYESVTMKVFQRIINNTHFLSSKRKLSFILLGLFANSYASGSEWMGDIKDFEACMKTVILSGDRTPCVMSRFTDGVEYYYSNSDETPPRPPYSLSMGYVGNHCSLEGECPNFFGTYFGAKISFDSSTGKPTKCELDINEKAVPNVNPDCSLGG